MHKTMSRGSALVFHTKHGMFHTKHQNGGKKCDLSHFNCGVDVGGG